MNHALGVSLALLLAGTALAQDPGTDMGEPIADAADPISRMFLFPWRHGLPLHPQFAGAVEDVEFKNAAGVTLRGWLFDAKGTDRTVLVCMGNTGNQSAMQPYAHLLWSGGFDVLLFDYQGFGRSDGVASVLSLVGDATAAFEFLTRSKGRSPREVGLLGISLGSVLAISIAAQKQAAAIAVEDVFLPAERLREVAGAMEDSFLARAAKGSLERLVLPVVDPVANARVLRAPILLIHGRNDWLLPPWGTAEVAGACAGPRRVWFLRDSGHAPETLDLEDREYAHQLTSFFREAFDTGTLDGPRVELRAVRQEEGAGSDAPRFVAALALESRSRQPIQIALADAEGRFHFDRRWLDAGRTTLEIRTAFRPAHASAIAYGHVVESGDSWEEALSPLSRSLREYRAFERGMFALDAWTLHRIESRTEAGHRMRSARRFSSAHWDRARERLPRPGDVHPRIRPRYARVLARIAVDLQRLEDPDAAAAAAEAMLPFCPEDTASHYDLDNASFSLGFAGREIADALFLLARRRLEAGRLEEAGDLLGRALDAAPRAFASPPRSGARRLAIVEAPQEAAAPPAGARRGE
jgi:fermentation-respiration switch protein FrsA (DUF1100 family)